MIKDWSWWPFGQRKVKAAHLEVGTRGEELAKEHLRKIGLKFLTANFRTRDGEIDLIFRDQDCLVFVEVKTRRSEEWGRPADAVTRAKKRRLSKTARQYLNSLPEPRVKFRFDIVEVLAEGDRPAEVRHLINAFPLVGRYLVA